MQVDGGAAVIPEWTLADRLRKARQHAGMKQKAFADALQVTSSAYAQWEAGNSKPRELVAIARRIELLTSVPAAWILGVESPTPPKLPRLDSNQKPAGYPFSQVRRGQSHLTVVPGAAAA